MPKFITKAILALAVMAGSFFAMWPAANNGFIWDDVDYVAHNSAIRDLSPQGLKAIFTKPDFGLYKPVTMVSLALNYKFAGENPRPYHITNIVLHAVNAALVFALLGLLTGNYWVAVLCAALFGVHPMHAESVAWISERKDMLYALFFLAASLAYVRFARTASKAALTVSVLCFLLSLGAKPMGITLPAVVFVYDYLLGRQFNFRLLYEKIPYIVAAALFGTVSFFLLHSANQVHLCYTFTDTVGGVITADQYSYIPSLGLFLPLAFHAVRSIAKLRDINKWFFRAAAIFAGRCRQGVYALRGVYRYAEGFRR